MQACSVVCSLQNTCHGEGSPGGRPPRPWKIAQLLSTHKLWPLNEPVSAQALPCTHVATSTHTVTVSLCGHCTLHRRWQLARIHVQIEPFTNECRIFFLIMYECNDRCPVATPSFEATRAVSLSANGSSCCCRSSFAGKNRSSEWSPTTPVPHLLDPRE